MSLNAIENEAFERFANAVGLPSIIYPNIQKLEQEANHLRVSVLPAPTQSVGISSLDQELGFIQALVYVKQGQGSIVASDIAEVVLALFPRNLKLTAFRIDRIGFTSPSFYDNTWLVLPVSISYQSLTA